jgi:hypothetical protein
MSEEVIDGKEDIPLNLPKEELFLLMMMAHERDITFNQLVEEALREFLTLVEKDPELWKKKMEKWETK